VFGISKPKEKVYPHSDQYIAGLKQLEVIEKKLMQARNLDAVAVIVRKAARNLTSADGATFVLRDGDQCYYFDEDAISPLWKGKRFPMCTCISGWVMVHKKPTVIEDIYKDPRIPLDAYKVTFVKSLLMVPIDRENPIGAIGNYWAHIKRPTEEEISLLQALADKTAIVLKSCFRDELMRKVATAA
jgi:two-component system CheB/CheR fusion protein